MHAYGLSRVKVKGEAYLLFFILSTRMLPPVVVAIPMYLMYRTVGLNDSHLGLILLYTAFNVSFAVWLMKGFIDEIPKEYEEAALVDGYTRMQAFWKIVLPEAATGIAATAVFCFITAWNEYAFARIMTTRKPQTATPFIPNPVGPGPPARPGGAKACALSWSGALRCGGTGGGLEAGQGGPKRPPNGSRRRKCHPIVARDCSASCWRSPCWPCPAARRWPMPSTATGAMATDDASRSTVPPSAGGSASRWPQTFRSPHRPHTSPPQGSPTD